MMTPWPWLVLTLGALLTPTPIRAAPISQMVMLLPLLLLTIDSVLRLSDVSESMVVIVPPAFTGPVPDVATGVRIVQYHGNHSGFGPSLGQLHHDLRHTLTRVTSSDHFQTVIMPRIVADYPHYSLPTELEADTYHQHWRLQPVSLEWCEDYGVYVVRSTLYFDEIINFDVIHLYDDLGQRRDDLDLMMTTAPGNYRVVRFPSVASDIMM